MHLSQFISLLNLFRPNSQFLPFVLSFSCFCNKNISSSFEGKDEASSSKEARGKHSSTILCKLKLDGKTSLSPFKICKSNDTKYGISSFASQVNTSFESNFAYFTNSSTEVNPTTFTASLKSLYNKSTPIFKFFFNKKLTIFSTTIFYNNTRNCL